MRNYETFSTTADAGIRFQGSNFYELYINALRGLNLLLFGRNPRRRAGSASVPFRFSGDGPENVLLNLLSAALALAYQDGKVVSAVDCERAEPKHLEAQLLVAPYARPPRLEIKAATYHDLRVTEKNGRLRAAVVFDV
jgi:SHS2 domain-containing protein